MSGHTNINTFLQSIKDSPWTWLFGAVVSGSIPLFFIPWLTLRSTDATERATEVTKLTYQNDVNTKIEEKNPYVSFSGKIDISPESGWISVLVYNSWDKDLYFTWNYPVVMKITSEVWSWKTINWNYPTKISKWETILIHGLFYGNWINESWKIKLWCEFQKWIIDSQGQEIPCSVYWEKVEESFIIPNLKDKKIIWIDASDWDDKVDFELLKKVISNYFIGTTSPWKLKWTGKVTITQKCSKSKRIFLFYNEKIVDEDLRYYMKEELFRYYSRLWAVDGIDEIIEFTFTDLFNPDYWSCEAQILDLISDCVKTTDWEKRNICSKEQKDFRSALENYKINYKQNYYTRNLVWEDIHFVFIIFANK